MCYEVKKAQGTPDKSWKVICVPRPPIFRFKKCIVAFCKIIACADIAGQDQIALKRAVWSGSAVFCKIIDIE